MKTHYYVEQFSDWIKGLPIFGKFGRDVSWNIICFGIMGISVVVMNVIIGRFYGAETLGVFNQVFAIFLGLSLFAGFGINFSVLKHVAEFSGDRFKCDTIITSAIVMVALFAGLITVFVFAVSGWIGGILESPNVTKGLLYVLPGLWCFALNKVFLATLNGYRYMKTFALTQAMRYILMIIMLVGCVFTQTQGVKLPAIISGAEIIVLIFLLVYILRFYTPVAPGKWSGWAHRHINFGARSFLSGAVDGLNARIDVLMLGYFANDNVVGIYSMASLLARGFAQLATAVRHNLNPLLTQFLTQDKTDKLKETVTHGVKLFYLAMGLVGIIAIITYPFFIKVFVHDSDFLASCTPFRIIMLGLMLCSGYLPFNMILLQTGYPGLHTLLKVAILLSSIILNVLLIPAIGMLGAAAATAVSYLFSALYLKLLVHKTLNIRI